MYEATNYALEHPDYPSPYKVSAASHRFAFREAAASAELAGASEPDKKIEASRGKAPLGIIPGAPGEARVYAYGGSKYAPGNWYTAKLEDGAAERYISAALRHLDEIHHPDGTYPVDWLATCDKESGLPHLDHAIVSLKMLRSLLAKEDVLPYDPGEGKSPPKKENA